MKRLHPFQGSMDPKRELPISIDDILATADGGTVYEEMYLSGKTFVNALYVSESGAFAFIAADRRDLDKFSVQAKEIAEKIGVHRRLLYAFFLTLEGDYAVRADQVEAFPVEDVCTAFDSLYGNLHAPRTDAYPVLSDVEAMFERSERGEDEEEENKEATVSEFVHNGVRFTIKDGEAEKASGIHWILVDEDTQEHIHDVCEPLLGNSCPDGDTKVEDGITYIRKERSVRIKGIDTGFAGKKEWFRVSDRDSRKMLWLTSILGWSGVHRLYEGNIAAFLWYLISCGMCGVFHVLDTFYFLTGSAGYDEVAYSEDEAGIITRSKERVYYRKVDKKEAFIAVLVAALIAFLMCRFVYRGLYDTIISFLSNKASEAASADPEAATQTVGSFLQQLGF